MIFPIWTMYRMQCGSLPACKTIVGTGIGLHDSFRMPGNFRVVLSG
ncbi:MAG: hypothetical protein MUF37_07460 [Methanoregulaceae archaeon]|jgi:hypothetical protein|nr:hypothetical protein [Methanoregulaceae archaeon]